MKEKSFLVGIIKLNKIIDIIAGISTLSIIIVVLIQIIGRSMENPAPWTEEATRFIFIWMIFLGISMGFRKGESARVTILIDKLPLRFKKMKLVLYNAFTLIFFVYMIIYGFEVMMQQVNMNEMGSALRIPMWLIGISVPISGLLGVIGVVELNITSKKKEKEI